MQALIFQQYKKTSATIPLQINNKNIGFFVAPISGTSKFLASANGQEWRLNFFIGSEFEQELTVHFNSNEPLNECLVGRACWLNNNGKTANDSGLMIHASQFLRKSGTLTLSHSRKLTSNRSLLADRDGIAYFSDNVDQFKRLVLCQSLAIAYTKVLYDCMARMTENVQKNLTEEALKLYEDILRFNAAHYFSLPILLERHELFAAWQVMWQHYHLNVLNQELTQQLSEVALLLRAQREQQRMRDEKDKRDAQERHRDAAKTEVRLQKDREDKKDKRRTFLLSLIGILLTALSLLQLTPTLFFENATAWKNWLFEPASNQIEKPKFDPRGAEPFRRK